MSKIPFGVLRRQSDNKLKVLQHLQSQSGRYLGMHVGESQTKRS